jgi:hypothetical protein
MDGHAVDVYIIIKEFGKPLFSVLNTIIDNIVPHNIAVYLDAKIMIISDNMSFID